MNSMGLNTKKILAAIAAAGVIISFAGCADKEQLSTDENTSTTSDTSSSNESSTASSSSETVESAPDTTSSSSKPEQSTPGSKTTASTPEKPAQSIDLPGNTDNSSAPTISDGGERSYLCSIHESGNGNFTFHYVSDKLVKVEYVAYIKGVPEEIEAKNKLSEYTGVEMVDKTDHYLFEIDMEQDGLKYLKDNFEIFKDLNDTSWKCVEEIMIDSGYSCRDNTLN